MTTPTSLPCALTRRATERRPCNPRPEPPRPDRGRARLTRSRAASSALAAALLFLALCASADASVKSYKWEDPSGETVYHPVPPDDPEQPYCMRRGDGPWTCYSGADTLERPAPDPDILTEAERQRRADQLLTSRYRSVDAIDASRDERLEQLEFEKRAVRQNLRSQRQILFGQIRAAADRQRAQLPITDRQLEDLEQVRTNLRSTEGTLARMDRQAIEIREAHEAMKDRYRELLQSNAPP